MNLLTIYPYLLENAVWVFDDPRTGLKEEAFVLGMSEMLSRLVRHKNIPDAAAGIAVTFGAEPFAGHDVHLTWLRSDDSQVVPGQDGSAAQIMGNWYSGEIAGESMTGWLCPALGLYFQAAPREIYLRVDPLPAGVDPIWHVAADDDRARRFVSASSAHKMP